MSWAVFLMVEINPLFVPVNVLDLMSCSLLEANVPLLADTYYCNYISPFLLTILFLCLHLPFRINF